MEGSNPILKNRNVGASFSQDLPRFLGITPTDSIISTWWFFTNPSEKYARRFVIISPKFRGVKITNIFETTGHVERTVWWCPWLVGKSKFETTHPDIDFPSIFFFWRLGCQTVRRRIENSRMPRPLSLMLPSSSTRCFEAGPPQGTYCWWFRNPKANQPGMLLKPCK